MKLKLTWLLTLLMVFSIQLSNAQESQITGKIIDPSGLPLPGVTIVVDGTSKGVVSDFDGVYSIKAKKGDVLRMSFIGMKTQRITVGEASTLNITMSEDLESLDAVVVTGYQNVDRELFTGASQTVKAADIKIDAVPDITRSLEGRAAGVSVQNVTGTFGAAPRITIRGSSSILGDTKPIWVIDGAIQEEIVDISFQDLVAGDINSLLSSALAGLNANDIESFEILRDASASAQYGARALNGVVVITTKSGKRNQKPAFNYSSEYAVRAVPSYNQYNLLNSQETVSIYRQLASPQVGQITNTGVVNGRTGGIYNLLYNSLEPNEQGVFEVSNTPEGRASFLQQYELANTDWFKELFRPTPTQTHTLSFSGGGDKSTTYASLGYFTDPGWTIADRVRRLTGNLRNTFYFGDDDRLKVTTQLNTSIRNQMAPGTLDRESDQFFGSFTREFDINPFNYALNTSRAIRPRDNNGDLEYVRNNWAPFNILEEVKNNYIELNVNDVRFQAQLDYQINDNLKYSFLGTARYASSISDHATTEFSNAAGAYRAADNTIIRDANTFLFQDPEQPNTSPYVVLPVGGILRNSRNTITTYTVRNTLEYKKRFKDDLHGLTIYGGQEYRHTDRSSGFDTGYGYQFSRGGTVFTDPDILRKAILDGDDYFGYQETRNREITLFANATYDFDKKYILNLSGNYEGSNRAGKSDGTRWLPTYTVSGRWNVHRENFIDNSGVLNNLVLRGSYGLSALIANTASNNEAIFRNQVTDRLLISDRENAIDIIDLQNSGLTWEKQTEYNLGLDIGLFGNRIAMNVDAYYRDGKDLIDFITTSGIGGESIKLGNFSSLETKGIEFQLNTVNVSGDDFKWNSGFNISLLNQKITELQQEPNVFDLITGGQFGNAVGYAPNSLFSFNFEGLDSDGYPTFTLPEDGIDFQSTDDPLSYLKYEGATLPNVTGGLANNFNYKNWDFSFFISFSAGNKIRLDPAYSSTYSDLSVFPTEFINRWLVPGDEEFTDIPVIPSTQLIQRRGTTDSRQIFNAYNYSSERIADGDFIRMKNITLGYSLDKNVVKKLGMTRFRLSLQTTNPFLIYSDDKLAGQDPEFIRSGGVAFPITRLYTFTVNVGF
ncbi:SusC/RagA family TonB-linked outer membrane protein [Algibacter amylolyticus]|uniref:SusC/RagA family TonB-linked outer membrane protein n=1 Tax=Algibacter amylolyticus TaxID=1608400 RepID=A0A5M7BFZ7_9FLAO|nr:SusC/RagA family TonB-linked outer membrane protein [Algibacter amylolyticus]KAA5826175.1 SusC/RagA family TonB-linked outer membrane protein [Algibacter amylolyticus]MBB5268375.1 TonB-linked SusC/RagA family outer membrane protein [Algibacter amylolyticus]TSJ80213.1 SusC/RagA family TonB-linked outer membrane protein [Algibacter amylolyticus]